MKKVILSVLAMASMLCACEKPECPKCEDNDSQSAETKSVMTISLDFDDNTHTKAITAYTASQTYETQVNKVQVLVFDADGKLNVYKNVGAATSASLSVSYGQKKVWAVVNGPDLSDISTESVLKAKAVALSENSTTATTGFVMAGMSSCNVSSSSVTASVSVSRLVSRIALQKVTNSLPSVYGNITIQRVFLANVVGNQNIGGSASISTWHNKGGRKDGATASSQIIDGTNNLAGCPALTYKAGASNAVLGTVAVGANHTPSSPYLFYSYPNSTSTDATAWNASAAKTRLVVVATISGTTYYYPVTINTPERNKTYTVELTIAGLGSTDPNVPVSKGSISTSISVQGWVAGASYEETI